MPRGHVGCGGIVKANGRAPRRTRHARGRGHALPPPLSLPGLWWRGRAPRRGARARAPGAAHAGGAGAEPSGSSPSSATRKTARTLEELRQPSRSATASSTAGCRQEGARIEADIAARQDAIFGDAPRARPDTDVRREDDVWVHGRRHDGRRPWLSGTHMEVKLGLVVQRGSSGPARTAGASLDRHYVGGTGSWTTFAERFTAALCRAMGVYEARRILFVSDGAAAIRWIRERSLPRRDRAARLVSPRRAAALRHRSAHQPAVLRAGPRGGPARGRRRAPRDPRGPCPHARCPTIPSRRHRCRARHRLRREQRAGASPTTASCPWPVLGTHGEGRRHHHLPALQDHGA